MRKFEGATGAAVFCNLMFDRVDERVAIESVRTQRENQDGNRFGSRTKTLNAYHFSAYILARLRSSTVMRHGLACTVVEQLHQWSLGFILRCASRSHQKFSLHKDHIRIPEMY